jgi:hypothetical protein
MQDINPNAWGSWEHEPEHKPEATQTGVTYDMYPDVWGRTDARETSEDNQHWKREANGGLGYAGYEGMNDSAPSRPLSAAAAAVRSTVRLG